MIAATVNPPVCSTHRRILIVDDNPLIHKDFRKVLNPDSEVVPGLGATEAAIFGYPLLPSSPAASFQVDSANQGKEALTMVQKAVADDVPYAMAFVDVRMPPGWDGIETVERIWKEYPQLQVVICTAYSDYSFDDMITRLGTTDRLVLLKKPFDAGEVLLLAHMLTEKWRLYREAQAKLNDWRDLAAKRAADLDQVNKGLEGAERILETVDSLLKTDLTSTQRDLASTVQESTDSLRLILARLRNS